MLSRIAFFAAIPVLGMAGGYFGVSSVMAPAAASQASVEASLNQTGGAQITFTETGVAGSSVAASPEAPVAEVKPLEEALYEMRVFANPEKAEDERLAGVLKLGRFSAQVGQGQDTTVLVADIAIDFDNRAVAAERWNKTALVAFRDTVLSSLLRAAELPEIRKAAYSDELLKDEMLLQLRAEIPGLTDLHLIKLSARHSSLDAPDTGVRIAVR